jgi:hypothetical protein
MPVVSWWVIPEGEAGQIVGVLDLHLARFTTVQGVAKPPNAVAGPFPNQLLAQQAANKLTQQNPQNPPPNIPVLSGVNAIGDFFQRLTEPSTWIRVAEFAAGGILLYIGGNALLRDTAAGTAIQSAKSGANKAVKGAATGLGAIPK